MSNLIPPTHSKHILVAFPAPHLLLLTFNRPKTLNAMTPRMKDDMTALLDWFENEPELWVVIVTGAGRIFCAGADLKAWNDDQQSGVTDEQDQILRKQPHGFGSISRRRSVKPIIAAVNGGAYGGGTEMVLNCDIVVASDDAKFALPEVKRGVTAIQGGIPRLAQISGHQLASEMLLLGKTITAGDARNRFGFVNEIVPAKDVVPAAISIAKQIVENSPDAVQSTKECLLIAQKGVGLHEVVQEHVQSGVSTRVYKGENIKVSGSEPEPPGVSRGGGRARGRPDVCCVRDVCARYAPSPPVTSPLSVSLSLSFCHVICFRCELIACLYYSFFFPVLFDIFFFFRFLAFLIPSLRFDALPKRSNSKNPPPHPRDISTENF